MVAVEEIEEGRLGAGDALDPARLQPAALEAQPLQIEDEILEPQTGAFAHRGRLRRLEVGHPETGLRRPALGEVGERRDDREQPGLDQRHGVAGDALLGVVADEAARGAEVENRLRRRRVLGKDVEVGHDIVPGLALDLGDPDEIVLGHLEVGAHLLDGLGRNLEPELRLGLGERQPHPPPGGVTVAGGEQVEHLGRGVAPRQRVVKAVEVCHTASIAAALFLPFSFSDRLAIREKRREEKERDIVQGWRLSRWSTSRLKSAGCAGCSSTSPGSRSTAWCRP